MVKLITSVALAASLAASVVLADIPKCGPGSPCPAETPCCSAYGQCGVGAYCLGGCDPKYSFKLTSCVANPVCQSTDYKLDSLNDVSDITKYLGDEKKANWQSQGQPVVYNDDSILLTMAPDTVGTLLASTHYVWYGKISATMTTSQGAGVVTAFIMMSDVKDEIDFEFVGVDLEHAQSNYYSQGVTNYNNGANLSVSNTVENVHTYTIDWTPDTLSWIIDGKVMRTKNRADTWNSTSNRFDYPQTPSRIMLSLWPAGLPSNAQGTIDWAGGLINWNSPYMTNGYYYAMIKDVTVECYDPPKGTQRKGNSVYRYTDPAGTNNTIIINDDPHILGSFYATGDNLGYNPNASKSQSAGQSKTGSAGAASSTTQAPETVPGLVGAGSHGEEGISSAASSATDAAGSSPTQGSGGSGGGSSGGSGGSGGGFSQGTPGSADGQNSADRTAVGGSAFAVLVALGALLVL